MNAGAKNKGQAAAENKSEDFGTIHDKVVASQNDNHIEPEAGFDIRGVKTATDDDIRRQTDLALHPQKSELHVEAAKAVEGMDGAGEFQRQTDKSPSAFEREFNQMLKDGYLDRVTAAANDDLPAGGDDVDMNEFDKMALKDAGLEGHEGDTKDSEFPDAEKKEGDHDENKEDKDPKQLADEVKETGDMAKDVADRVAESADMIADLVGDIQEAVEDISNSDVEDNLDMAADVAAGNTPETEGGEAKPAADEAGAGEERLPEPGPKPEPPQKPDQRFPGTAAKKQAAAKGADKTTRPFVGKAKAEDSAPTSGKHVYGYLQFEHMPNKDIKVAAAPGHIDDIKEELDAEGHAGDDKMYDLLSGPGNGHALGNGYTIVKPEDVGALTDGLLIGDGNYDDSGENYTGNVWWFADYAVKGFVEELAAGNAITLVYGGYARNGGEPIKTEGRHAKAMAGKGKKKVVAREDEVEGIHNKYYDIALYADGSLKYSLGNFSDAGWFWDGSSGDNQSLLLLFRIGNSSTRKDFIKDLAANPKIKQALDALVAKEAKEDEALGLLAYAATGDNSFWNFGGFGEYVSNRVEEEAYQIVHNKEFRGKVVVTELDSDKIRDHLSENFEPYEETAKQKMLDAAKEFYRGEDLTVDFLLREGKFAKDNGDAGCSDDVVQAFDDEFYSSVSAAIKVLEDEPEDSAIRVQLKPPLKQQPTEPDEQQTNIFDQGAEKKKASLKSYAGFMKRSGMTATAEGGAEGDGIDHEALDADIAKMQKNLDSWAKKDSDGVIKTYYNEMMKWAKANPSKSIEYWDDEGGGVLFDRLGDTDQVMSAWGDGTVGKEDDDYSEVADDIVMREIGNKVPAGYFTTWHDGSAYIAISPEKVYELVEGRPYNPDQTTVDEILGPKAVKAIRAYASMHRRIDADDFGKFCAGMGVTVEAGKKVMAGYPTRKQREAEHRRVSKWRYDIVGNALINPAMEGDDRRQYDEVGHANTIEKAQEIAKAEAAKGTTDIEIVEYADDNGNGVFDKEVGRQKVKAAIWREGAPHIVVEILPDENGKYDNGFEVLDKYVGSNGVSVPGPKAHQHRFADIPADIEEKIKADPRFRVTKVPGKVEAANYGKGEPNGAFYHKIKTFVQNLVKDKEQAKVSWQDDKESIYNEVREFVADEQGSVSPSMQWVKRMTDHALRNLATVAAEAAQKATADAKAEAQRAGMAGRAARTVSHEVFTYAELSKEAKENAKKWYQERNEFYDDSEIEVAHEVLKDLGFRDI